MQNKTHSVESNPLKKNTFSCFFEVNSNSVIIQLNMDIFVLYYNWSYVNKVNKSLDKTVSFGLFLWNDHILSSLLSRQYPWKHQNLIVSV